MKSLLPVPAKIPGPTKLVVAALIFAAFFIKSPYVILSPGNPQNILGPAITISGTKIYPTTGKLSVTSVMVTDPDSYMTGFDVLYAWMSDERAVMPRVEIYPQGESVEDSIRAGVQEMTDSQVSATAAALGYLGYELNSKLIISQVNEQTNAYKVLKVGDEVISLDNIKYKSQSEIARSLDEKNPGQIVSIKVLRSGSQIIEEQIKLSAREDGSAYIGIGITNKYDFPFEVKIQLKETGGPSGGLIFALGIIDKLTEQDLIRSRNIAGTGTISTSGQVGPIGGIAEKIIGAEKAGVQVFFTPVQNCAELVDIDQILKNKGPKGMKIVPVATLSEAVSILNMPNNAQYPSCKSIA